MFRRVIEEVNQDCHSSNVGLSLGNWSYKPWLSSVIIPCSMISGNYLAFIFINICKVYVKWLRHRKLVPLQGTVEVVLLIVWYTFFLVVNRSLGWIMTYSLLSSILWGRYLMINNFLFCSCFWRLILSLTE